MAKVNYKFQKRQKELERQKKKEEKVLRKQETKATEEDATEAPLPEEDSAE